MFDEKTKKLIDYIKSQQESIKKFDETKNERGIKAKLATAHKQGYLEALKNIEAVINKNMTYGKNY